MARFLRRKPHNNPFARYGGVSSIQPNSPQRAIQFLNPIEPRLESILLGQME